MENGFLGSNFGGDEKNKPSDFYEGKYPTCVKNGEFIFDEHLFDGKKQCSLTACLIYILLCNSKSVDQIDLLSKFDNKKLFKMLK